MWVSAGAVTYLIQTAYVRPELAVSSSVLWLTSTQYSVFGAPSRRGNLLVNGTCDVMAPHAGQCDTHVSMAGLAVRCAACFSGTRDLCVSVLSCALQLVSYRLRSSMIRFEVLFKVCCPDCRRFRCQSTSGVCTMYEDGRYMQQWVQQDEHL